jgi:hypothetical protein
MIPRAVVIALCLMGVTFYLLFLWALIVDSRLRRASERSLAERRKAATSQKGTNIRKQWRLGKRGVSDEESLLYHFQRGLGPDPRRTSTLSQERGCALPGSEAVRSIPDTPQPSEIVRRRVRNGL